MLSLDISRPLALPRYSLHNVMLIASQKPNASYVAGFRTWNELGRFVKKGEKAS